MAAREPAPHLQPRCAGRQGGSADKKPLDTESILTARLAGAILCPVTLWRAFVAATARRRRRRQPLEDANRPVQGGAAMKRTVATLAAVVSLACAASASAATDWYVDKHA